MAQKSVDIPEDYREFISDTLSRGHYRDEREVISAGLDLLKKQEKENQTKLEALRVEAQKGLDAYHRGEYTTLETDEDITRFMNEIADEVDEEIARA